MSGRFPMGWSTAVVVEESAMALAYIDRNGATILMVAPLCIIWSFAHANRGASRLLKPCLPIH
jgi:hypothetical protein